MSGPQIHNEDIYTAIAAIRQTQIDEVEKAAEHRGKVSGLFERVDKLEAHNTREDWKNYGKHTLTAVAAILGHKVLKIMGWNI